MGELEFSIEKFLVPTEKYFLPWIRDLNEELKTQADNVKNLTDRLYETERISISGGGRSGLVSLYSGIRFIHIGYDVQRVGDFLIRPIGNKKDVMLCISGSGETNTVVNSAMIAKKNKVPILSITSKPDSSLGAISDEKIIIKGRTKQIKEYEMSQLKQPEEPISYLGSEFELKALLLSELIVNYLAKRKGVSEKDMHKEHTNLE